MGKPMNWTRRSFLGGCAAGLGLCLGCTSDGHLSLLGYTTKPNYDENIRSVYVPIFRSEVFETGPFRGMNYQLTRAVVREIEARTPYKVISDPDRADTELKGNIVVLNKLLLTVNQTAEVRNLDLLLGVDVVWRDLRTGRVLSNPRPRVPEAGFEQPFDPSVPVPIEPIEYAFPRRITVTGRMIPELGESSTTARQMAIDRMAVEIAQLMEKPWDLCDCQ